MKADFVVDQVRGDTGKGRVVNYLLNRDRYTHCVKAGAGVNCGHTIYHKGKKIVTHGIPSGIAYGIKSIIAPECFLHVRKFFEEVEYLEKNGIPADKLIKISSSVHIITDDHIAEEAGESVIGTTRTGNGPCARDKALRVGLRAENVPEFKPYLIDFHDEIFDEVNGENILLFEGAQGYHLDLGAATYPYVTSSRPTLAGALLNGVPHIAIRNVVGVCKAYDTYVGAMKFQGDDPILDEIGKLGFEFGATTGRKRAVNFLNIAELTRAMQVTAPKKLFVNKMDILQQVDTWKVRLGIDQILDLKTEDTFKAFLAEKFPNVEIIYSYSPEHI